MKSIYIVDDDHQICETIRLALAPLGHKITLCMTGQEALDCIGQESPQVVILDVMLPDINGVEVFQKIRSTEMGKNLPVILMTGSSAQIGVKDQWSAFLKKPFDLDSLVGEVEKFMADV